MNLQFEHEEEMEPPMHQQLVPDENQPTQVDMEERLKIQNMALTKLIHHLEKSSEPSDNSFKP